jgi:hypothetical protein
MALSFQGTAEAPHFDRAAFKVIEKRIFATLHEASLTANLKLSEVDQSVFCVYDKTIVYPVPNKWGLQGWTTFELRKSRKNLCWMPWILLIKTCLKPNRRRNKAKSL